jgi:hypothetical protein
MLTWLYQRDIYYDALEVTGRRWEQTIGFLEDQVAKAKM